MKADKTLKALNVKSIWAVVVADALILAAAAFPDALGNAASIPWGRLLGAAAAPVVVLLLTSLLPSGAKAALVFWRVRHVLPGHRAFSVYAPTDPRIDLQRLRAAVGEFPAPPRDQNSLWYRLLKKVDGEPIVAEAHRYFLLLRDLAALSILLAVLAPASLYLMADEPAAPWIALGLFVVQYFAAAVAARWQGTRLVCNVLALHAAADKPKTRKPAHRALAKSTT